MQLPRAMREHNDAFEPRRGCKSDAFAGKRRMIGYAEHKRTSTEPRRASPPLGEAESRPDEFELLGGGIHPRTHPRQVRRNLFAIGNLDDSVGTRKAGRLTGRQSKSTAVGEDLNQGGQGVNGDGVGNSIANGKPNPSSLAFEEGGGDGDEAESDSEDEDGEVDSDDEEEAVVDDSGEEEENGLGKEELLGQTQNENKGKLSPSVTTSIGLGTSQTASAIVTLSGAPSIAYTGVPSYPPVSQPSEQGESPAPDLLQPFQKAAIATGAIVSGIIVLLVFAFFFMRSRHGSDYSSWPCLRRCGRKRLRLNSKMESGITILPPPPFQKEDPWIITKERQPWMGNRRPPPLASEMKTHHRVPSRLQNKPLIRRLLAAPLESNPITRPPSAASPLHFELGTEPAPDFDPSRVSNLFSPRNNSRLTISTRSSQALPEDEQPEISDTRSIGSYPHPQNSRRLPGVSYLSWTVSSQTTVLNKYHSFMSRSGTSNRRETMTTVDSEPPRFRSISSWANQQYKRVNGASDLPPPPVPRKDNVSTASPQSAGVADSLLKQSMKQNTQSPTKTPLLLSKPTPPHPPIPPTSLRPSVRNTSSAQIFTETPIPPVPPLPSPNSLPPPPPTPLKRRADSKYHQRTVSVSTNATAPTASIHRKNVSSTTSSLPILFKHHPGDKVEINRL